MSKDPLIQYFNSDISGIEQPERFTFPFYYEPHPLCRIASAEVQDYLNNQTDWKHNFGLDPRHSGAAIGKMFGVLVIETQTGELGYLAAFSGKLAESNHLDRFVPPVFDTLNLAGFYKAGEEEVNIMTRRIKALQSEPAYHEAKAHYEQVQADAEQAIKREKDKIKAGKKQRKALRARGAKELGKKGYEELVESLKHESIRHNYYLKDLTRDLEERVAIAKAEYNSYEKPIQDLLKQRRQMSSDLQNKLFDQYTFLNANGESRSLLSIFSEAIFKLPPAGAGECAAPKLLQYAFTHKLKPVAMAEFWWGAAMTTIIRKQGHFYPACRGKCEPILNHMLVGLDIDPNPMLNNPAEGQIVKIVYEDEAIVVINKPAEFLSVPGKQIFDSVFARMKKRYPDADGPLIVHRLDMSTSGLMLIAKTAEAHKHLQRQFIKRLINKRYTALLNGIISEEEGTIDLPLRVDLNDRPRQQVCYEHGKSARTLWKKVGIENGRTRIHFFPITGRTHQLRVHAAHPLGLNHSIIGDDLYGQKADRLYLHAEQIAFTHPTTEETMTFEEAPDF